MLSCLQMARAFGGRIIIAVDISDKKLENAMKMGATHTINGSTEDVPERIRVSHFRTGLRMRLLNRFLVCNDTQILVLQFLYVHT